MLEKINYNPDGTIYSKITHYNKNVENHKYYYGAHSILTSCNTFVNNSYYGIVKAYDFSGNNIRYFMKIKTYKNFKSGGVLNGIYLTLNY